MDVPEILITAGVVSVLASIAGGGLKGFGIEVPLLASIRRQVALLVVGAALVGLGFYSSWQGKPSRAGAEPVQPSPVTPPEENKITPAVPPSPAAAAQPDTPNIVDLPFPAARQFLIQNSWSPINTATTPNAMEESLGMRTDEILQAGYREAVSCSGTGGAPCMFRYRHPSGAILEVVTVGEDIKTATVNSAKILDCKAEPKPEGCAW